MGRKEDQIKRAAKTSLVIFAQTLSNDLDMESIFEEGCIDEPIISKMVWLQFQ